jgi:hypothetical protein
VSLVSSDQEVVSSKLEKVIYCEEQKYPIKGQSKNKQTRLVYIKVPNYLNKCYTKNEISILV